MKPLDWLLVVGIVAFVFGIAYLVCRRGPAGEPFFLRVAHRLTGPISGYKSSDWIEAIVTIGGWCLFFIVLLGVMGFMAGWIGLLLWLASIVVALMVVGRYREMERRSLLWLLAIATEKGIPLASAVRAFADERSDGLGVRARLLAEALERGMPLDKALEASYNRLPNDALVAMHTGCETGTLAAMLKNAVRHAATLDAAAHAAVARVVYLISFVFFATVLMTFIGIQIIPAFIKIYADFKTDLPPVTILLINFFHIFVRYSPITFAGMLFLLFIFLYAVGRYIGIVKWDPPLVRKVSLPLDESLLLRALAESVQQQRPLAGAIDVLARIYPKSYVRLRLYNAAKRIDQGAHWCDSLQASGLLPSAEAGVLKSAERVGNLVWAMNEMADRLTRKFTTRMTGLMSVGFPIVLLGFASVVLLVAVGMIFPLAKLITDLS